MRNRRLVKPSPGLLPGFPAIHGAKVFLLIVAFYIIFLIMHVMLILVLSPRSTEFSHVPLVSIEALTPTIYCMSVYGQIRIPISKPMINDLFCDCVDGSDELLTNACSYSSRNATFVCHPNLNIPSSQVADGICDCPRTCSDEPQAGNTLLKLINR